MALYQSAKSLTCLDFHLFHMGQGKIKHRMASPTDKVIMGVLVGIKAIGTVCGNFGNFSQLGQQRKIAVDGSQANMGKFPPDIAIDYIRSGMVLASHKKLLNGFSLSAVLYHGHGHVPFLITGHNKHWLHAFYNNVCPGVPEEQAHFWD